jgi:hypothetical protein
VVENKMTQLAFKPREVYFESDTKRSQQIMKYLTETIEQQQPENVHHSLVQAYAKLYEMMEELWTENQTIRKMVHAEPEDVKNILMGETVKRNYEYLVANYRGEYVALTFDGKVAEHSKSQIELLKKIDSLAIPKNQIFVYSVPLL